MAVPMMGQEAGANSPSESGAETLAHHLTALSSCRKRKWWEGCFSQLSCNLCSSLRALQPFGLLARVRKRELPSSHPALTRAPGHVPMTFFPHLIFKITHFLPPSASFQASTPIPSPC